MRDSEIHISTRTLVRFWLVIIGLALILLGLWLAQTAVIVIVVSFFLALVLNRPVSFFARHIPGKSRGLGVFISYIITIAIIAGVLVLILPVFFEQSAIFLKALPETIAEISANSGWVTDLVNQYHLQDQYNAFIADINASVSNLGSGLASFTVDFISGLANWILGLVFVLFITFFMLTEGPYWLSKFWELAYKNAERRQRHKAVASKMYEVISNFVSGQIAVAALSGVLAGIGAFALSIIFGFPASITLPTVAIVFVSSFIPMFGGFIGGLISAVLILLYNPIAALVYVVYFLLYQQFLGNWFMPKVQGRKMNTSPLLVLLALVIGFQIGGIFGALVSIPLAGCAVVLVREYFKRRAEKTESCDDPSHTPIDGSTPGEEKEAKRDFKIKEPTKKKPKSQKKYKLEGINSKIN